MYSHEPYLNIITNKKYRRIISKFRTSAHDLEIELGRYSGIDRSDRICKLCRRFVVNELYFVLMCIMFEELREYLISPSIYYIISIS